MLVLITNLPIQKPRGWQRMAALVKPQKNSINTPPLKQKTAEYWNLPILWWQLGVISPQPYLNQPLLPTEHGVETDLQMKWFVSKK